MIGGGAAAAGELLLEPARRVLAARGSAAGARPGARRAGGARADAGFIGAAALALTELFPRTRR